MLLSGISKTYCWKHTIIMLVTSRTSLKKLVKK